MVAQRMAAERAASERAARLAAPQKTTPKRSKADGDALRAEALIMVHKSPGAWSLRSLAQHLARRHKVQPAVVIWELEQSPDFRRPTELPAGGPRPRPVKASASVRSWASLVTDVALWLSEADTDSLGVEVTSAASARLELRYDFVRTMAGVQLWLTAAAPGPAVLAAYLRTDPWSLTPPGVLPLVPAPARLTAPAVLVWRHSTPQEAAATLSTVLGDGLGVRIERLRVERHQCTPAELDRRTTDEGTVRRITARRGARRAAVSQCDRCGQPLSDPVSVQLGIGPECRRYYSQQVLRRLQRPGSYSPRPGSVKEKEWLALVRPWLLDSRSTP